jgi:hypothetical protein
MKTLNITIIDRMLSIYYGGGENFTVLSKMEKEDF